MASTPEIPHANASSIDLATASLRSEIDSLRLEIEGLRASAQLRALIEQAKGVLVAREGITLDEAFVRLRRMSQEHNVRLVEVAATIVGVAVPLSDEVGSALAVDVLQSQLPESRSPSTTWRALQRQPEIRAGLLNALLDTVTASTSEGDEAAQLLFDLLSPLELNGLTLYRAVLDGSLRAIGSVGLEPDTASAWRTIPLSFDVPLSRAVLERRAMFFGDHTVRATEFPAVDGAATKYEATASIPVFDDGQVVGAVGLLWETPREFDEEAQAAITRSVGRVAPLVIRHASESDLDLDWLQLLLGLHVEPWLLLDSISSADDQFRHFIVQAVSNRLNGTAWLGRRLLEIWPEAAADGTWDSLVSLVRTGGRWTMQVGVESRAPWGIPGTHVRAVRLGRRVIIVWHPPVE